MTLPLLTRALEDDGTFVHMVTARTREAESRRHTAAPSICSIDATGRMPDRHPAPGEQYRFHVNMESCIGCKCCVVACNEQNGNPASINWRRVGEVEGGTYPSARKAYFSMGCNHCADPTCLTGCPVDAYSKDETTGIVRHSADTCIGCQYCTWTCSYGVPQFNPERGVVGKCDMCYGRLEVGQAPACVTACPEGALAIEIVNVAEWRTAVAAGARNGLPSADASLSMTRVTMNTALPEQVLPTGSDRFEPEHAHAPLIAMTVLTQLAAGAFATILAAQLTGVAAHLNVAALAALQIGGLALAAATLHLGRPIHAYRAMKMWRRSWLSREVLLFGAFVHVAAAYVAMLWLDIPRSVLAGALTVGLGAAGVFASGRLYLVASRPAWNTGWTIVRFGLTAALLGPLFAAAAGVGDPRWWRVLGPLAAFAATAVVVKRHHRNAASPELELRGTSELEATTLGRWFRRRLVLLACAALLPIASGHPIALGCAFAAGLASEFVGRYLFFVTVVPRHMTAPYLSGEREAA